MFVRVVRAELAEVFAVVAVALAVVAVALAMIAILLTLFKVAFIVTVVLVSVDSAKVARFVSVATAVVTLVAVA